MRNDDIEVSARRWFLLCVVRDEYPAVLASLRQQPLEAFKALPPSEQYEIEDALQMPPYAPRAEPMIEFLRVLDDWARRWSLRAPWVFEVAARTLLQWSVPGLDDPDTGWRTMPGLAFYDPGPTEPFEVAPWSPIYETAAAFRERIEAAARLHIQAVKARFDAAGWRATPTPAVITHAGWLAKYQVAGESFTAIAKASPDHSNAGARTQVSRAVHAYAKTIGLPLRVKSRGGRPRGRTAVGVVAT